MIRQFQKETYAYKCKLVALIQLGKIAEAYDFIKKANLEHLGYVIYGRHYFVIQFLVMLLLKKLMFTIVEMKMSKLKKN